MPAAILGLERVLGFAHENGSWGFALDVWFLRLYYSVDPIEPVRCQIEVSNRELSPVGIRTLRRVVGYSALVTRHQHFLGSP
jgi:hypothetical protein